MIRHLRLLAADAIPDWQTRANCTGTDTDAFYPDAGGSARAAKRICSRCEVTAECLRHAIDQGERHGVWGGMTERERRALRQPGTAAA